MSDDNNQTTDDEQPDLPPELLARAEEMEDDDTLDFDSKQRQDEGWLKVYVECPECEVPMARNTVESESVDVDFARDANETVIRAICPDCGLIASHLKITRVTGEFGTLDTVFEEMTDDD